jgi:hypothetical protein
MPNAPRNRFSIGPKKKKRVLSADDHFLKKSFHWLNWKLIRVGDITFLKPCLNE